MLFVLRCVDVQSSSGAKRNAWKFERSEIRNFGHLLLGHTMLTFFAFCFWDRCQKFEWSEKECLEIRAEGNLDIYFKNMENWTFLAPIFHPIIDVQSSSGGVWLELRANQKLETLDIYWLNHENWLIFGYFSPKNGRRE